ncbi:MAG: hybrid sensor histidine kinase/response regulator [Pseudomonadota bacterium]
MVDALGKDTQRVKCLIVDDLQENLLALSALLRDEPVEVLQARSGREALELLLVHDVALALVDVQMPDMDGFELAELMRGSERTQRVPIIFVTAGSRDQQRVFKGYDSGAVDFLFKPIEAHILKSKANVFFQLHRQTLQLAQQLEERTETLRLKEMFTAVLGHDLRGPLSAILMSAQLLSKRPDEASQKVGLRLLRSGQWMNRMIEDMLDLTRARVGGGIPVSRQPSDLGELSERVIQERQSTCPGRTIDFQRQGDLRGAWDGDRLTQLVSNLVGNAVIHGDPTQPITVQLDGSRSERVVLSVANGGAIPPALLPHIFNPFRSGRKAAHQAEGLGLGLFIAQQIVRAHGGRIEVRTDVPDTTRFEVSLPRQ